MCKLNPNSAIPLYQQLYDKVMENIQTGVYKAGDKIPSEMQLSSTFAISRITVRAALQQLVDNNILVKKHGKGTFVAQFGQQPLPMFPGGSFTDTCLRISARPNTRVLSCQTIPSSKKSACKMDIDRSSEVILVRRLRLVDDIPCIIELDYLPRHFDFLLNRDLSDCSLFQLIQQEKGIAAAEFEDFFSIEHATKEYAELLLCRVGFPLLKVDQNVMDKSGSVIYYNEQLIHSDRYPYGVRSFAKTPEASI